MHHYDMNLCYIDELLWHFKWTGDLDYARQMWPVITRHLAWEKLNLSLIHIFGKEGEEEAAAYLIDKGYSIRHRNWHCGKKELDIVAEYRNELIVIEVKTCLLYTSKQVF